MKQPCSKNDSTCTFTSLPTPLTRQDYSLELYTVLCSGSSRYAQTTRINYNEQNFFKRLIARGYKGNKIRPLFHKAITRAKAYSGPTQDENDDHNSIILHLPFHPNNPASSRIQAEWRTHVAKPQWNLPLEHMKNPKTKEKCTLHIKIYAQRNFPTLQYYRAVLPYQPAREKSDFRISTSIFCILLSFFCHPHGFLNFLFAR